MSDGKDLKGFNETKPVGSSPWSTESYTEAPKAAFPSTDKSSQDGAGVNKGGK
jgi:hypothetical protein